MLANNSAALGSTASFASSSSSSSSSGGAQERHQMRRVQGSASASSSSSSSRRALPEYVRRLVDFKQMDFQAALSQMAHLLRAPSEVYKSSHYHKGMRACSSAQLFLAESVSPPPSRARPQSCSRVFFTLNYLKSVGECALPANRDQESVGARRPGIRRAAARVSARGFGRLCHRLSLLVRLAVSDSCCTYVFSNRKSYEARLISFA
jgi:hypothetical protein